MSGSLLPCEKKIERGEKHLADLETAFKVGERDNLYGVVLKVNPETRNRSRRVEFPDELRLEYGIMVGDICHNFRSALDHLIAQLVLAKGDKIPNSGNGFPLFHEDPLRVVPKGSSKRVRKAAEKDRDKWLRNVSGVDSGAIAVLTDLQPHKAPNSLLTQSLSVLTDLWNRDKHRVINLGAVEITGSRATIGPGGEPVHIETLTFGPLSGVHEHGTEVYGFTLGEDTPDVQVDEEFSVQIVFEESGPLAKLPVLPELVKLGEAVKDTCNLFGPVFR